MQSLDYIVWSNQYTVNYMYLMRYPMLHDQIKGMKYVTGSTVKSIVKLGLKVKE